MILYILYVIMAVEVLDDELDQRRFDEPHDTVEKEVEDVSRSKK